MTNGIGKRIEAWLARPYPLWRGAWPETRFAVVTTALVTAIVHVARPFGLGALPPATAGPLIVSLGLACLAATLALRVVLPALAARRWDESRWTVGREALREIVEVAAVAGALMTVLAGFGLVEFSATRARSFVAVTALCAVAPVIVRLLATERWLRERHERHAAALVDDATPPADPHGACLIRARDGVLELDADALRYVRAEANYVDVVFRRDGVRSHRLLRVAIADVERQFAPGVVVRCHRSYLVATAAIARVRGNAQGYRLALRDLTETVPVARSRAKAVLARLAQRREAATVAAAPPDDDTDAASATDDAS